MGRTEHTQTSQTSVQDTLLPSELTLSASSGWRGVTLPKHMCDALLLLASAHVSTFMQGQFPQGMLASRADSTQAHVFPTILQLLKGS